MIRTLLKPLSFVPALLLMYMIFSFSNQPGEVSSQLSYKVSYKIVQAADYVFDAGLEEWQIGEWADKIHFITRKLAHMTEYFALAVAVSFPLYVYGLHGILLMLVAGLICVGFACGDEYHQAFVAGRGPSVKDVCIDSVGVFFGIIFVRIIGWTGRKTIFKPKEKVKVKKTKAKKMRGKKGNYSDDDYEDDDRNAPYPQPPYRKPTVQEPPYGWNGDRRASYQPEGRYQEPPYRTDGRYQESPYEPDDRYRESPRRTDSRYQETPYGPDDRYRESPYRTDGRYQESPYEPDDRYRESPRRTDSRYQEPPYGPDDRYRESSRRTDSRYQETPYGPDDRYRESPRRTDSRYQETPYGPDGRYRDNPYEQDSSRQTPYYGRDEYREVPYERENDWRTPEDDWLDEEDIDIDSAPDASYDAEWEDPSRADDWGMEPPPVPKRTPRGKPPVTEQPPKRRPEPQPKKKKKEKNWFFDM